MRIVEIYKILIVENPVCVWRKYTDNMCSKKQLSCQTHSKHTITEFTHLCLMIQNTKQSSVYHFV